MRWSAVFLLVAGLTAASAGCRAPRATEPLEAELRARDNDLRDVRTELERSQAYNHFLERELHNAPHTAASPPGDGPPPPSPVKSIALGRQTGGYEEDGIPGDEALQVILQPLDIDGHSIKAAGTADVTALEIMPEGVKKPLSTWHVDADQLRRSWQSGLLCTGYFLVLPWKTWPSNPKLRVVVQFISEENRLFEAYKDVTVRVAPAMYRKPPPPAEDKPMPLVPPRPADAPLVPPKEGGTLPPPRKLEPDKKDDTLPLPRKLEPDKKDDKKEEKKDEKKEEKKDEKELPSPPLPEAPAPSDDPLRPLKGAVELLRPVAVSDDE